MCLNIGRFALEISYLLRQERRTCIYDLNYGTSSIHFKIPSLHRYIQVWFVNLWASWIKYQLHNLMLAFLHRCQACVILSLLHGVLLLLKLVISFVLTCVGLC